MSSARYFFDDGDSRKFWSYALRGKRLTLRHGRIGTDGRETTKLFPSATEAEREVLKLAGQKVKKGYVKVAPENLKLTRLKGMRRSDRN